MSSATANDVINDVRTSNNASLPAMLGKSLPAAFRKFSPAKMRHNPVMFVVWVGAAFLTLLGVFQLFIPELRAGEPVYFTWIIAVCLWATVLFANLAEAVAEGRGKAQADALRKTRTTTPAHLVHGYDEKGDPDARSLSVAIIEVPSSDLKLGDVVVVEAGQLIPGDGDIISGIASVDESAITGESAPVIRESGGDRSAVTGGTRVLSDRIVVRITQKPGESFVDKMIALVEGANRQKTPNEIALDVLLSSLTIIFLIVVMCLNPQAGAVGTSVSLTVLVALLVCLIPTTIGALLSAIGIAGTCTASVRSCCKATQDPQMVRERHRHRRHGPSGSAQRARHVGPRYRSGRRRDRAAARQDRHHHVRQPSGIRIPRAAGHRP